jgi:hypothetical protein
LIRYLEVTAERDANMVTVVLLPELVIQHWWERFLFNQNVHRIRDALAGRPGILVAEVPFQAPEPGSLTAADGHVPRGRQG